MRLPFLAPENDSGNFPINLYHHPQAFNGQPGWVGTPGTKDFCDIGASVPVRGMRVVGSTLYVVAGNKFYSVDAAGAETEQGTLNTATGYCWIVDCATQIMIVDGTDGYTYTIATDTFAAISDGDFPTTPGSLTYQDGYGIVTVNAAATFNLSALLNFTAWDALDYAGVDGYSDPLVTVVSNMRELYLLGTEALEVWQNTGNADFPFERIPGGISMVGCGAAASAIQHNETVYWLADDWTVQAIPPGTYTPKMISTPALNDLLVGYSTKSDAIGFGYSWRGHDIYVLTFPTQNITWCYNVASGSWYQWASYSSDGRHRANCYAYFNNKHLVGDYANGKIFELDAATYTDNGTNAITRQRIFGPIDAEDKPWVFHRRVELEMKSGVDTNPAAYWPCDELSGTSATDKSGSSTGTLEGGASFDASGKLGYCLLCDGLTGRMDCGNTSAISGFGSGSWWASFWMKSGATIKNNGRLLSKEAVGGDTINLRSDTTVNRLRATLTKGATTGGAQFTDATPFDGSWHHIVFAIDRTANLLKVWVDTVVSAVTLDISSFPAVSSNSSNLSWGAINDGSSPYDGRLDEMRVYSGVPTTTEIENLYSKFTGIGPTMTLYWSEDGGRTWSTGVTANIGELSEKTKRIIWRRLGRSRKRLYKLRGTDSVEHIMTGCYAEVEKG